MADTVVTAEAAATTCAEEYRNYVHEDRRYVPRKEVVAYIIYDVAQSFNINKYTERFNLDVLHVSLFLIPIVDFWGGIWDAVNDTIIGALVDRTRTRWGKFKPYLLTLAIPIALGTCMFWFLPILFPNAPEDSVPKFIAYFALALIRETAGTFQDISRTGMLSTISPHPIERTRLITMAQLLSFGDQLPELTMTLMIDMVNKNVINIPMRSVYLIIGCGSAIVAGLMSLYFAAVAKERVIQSVEKPNIKQSIMSIARNKPILLITLSEFLSAFSLSTGMTNYYVDVLGSASLYMVVGIPGGFVSTPSYAWVPWFRRKFATRTLWILGSITGDALMFLVFLFGSIGGRVNGLYKRVGPMIGAIMIQETLFMSVFGIRKVIPQEMFNEAMDYCEWKNGYRTEAMTGVAKGLARKFVDTFGKTIRSLLMIKIGYQQSAGHLNQSDDTKYYLFAMATALPFVTSLLGVIPKLFYDLSGAKRDTMYAELLQRRAEASVQASGGDAESMKLLAAQQMSVAEQDKKL
ncbi:MAG: MFS transporter [Oscillospiraceae bacterium]|nr:MFS transporter [Oscillospiraceae bacterium]